MRGHYIVILLLLAGFLFASPLEAQEPTHVFTIRLPIRPIGVFRNYVIGYTEPAYRLVAVDIDTQRVIDIASLDALGLEPSELRLVETSWLFAVYDSDDVAVFNNGLRLAGRFSYENQGFFVIQPSGRIILWHDTVVNILNPPGYSIARSIDAWEKIRWLLTKGIVCPDTWLVKAFGVHPAQEARRIADEYARTGNVTIVSVDWRAWYDIEAHSVSEARAKLVVNPVSAILLANNTVLIAANVLFKTILEVRIVYAMSVEDGTVTGEAVVIREFTAPRGILISVGPDDTASPLDYYEYIETAGFGAVSVYVYRPFLWKTSAPRVLVTATEFGDFYEAPLYVYSEIAEAVVAPSTQSIVLLRTTGNVVYLVYNGEIKWTFRAQRITDIGGSDRLGLVYFSYINAMGSFEIGVTSSLMAESGRITRVAMDLGVPVVGVYVSGAAVYTAAVEEGYLTIYGYTLAVSANVRIVITDPNGALVPVESGRITVIHGAFTYTYHLDCPVTEILVPVPSKVIVEAFVPYGYASDGFNVQAPGTIERRVVASIALRDYPSVTPPRLSGLEGFYGDLVLVSDTEVSKAILPGASALDAWGPFLAMVDVASNKTMSIIRVYRHTTELYSRIVPGLVDRIKIMYPYLVARTVDSLYVYELMTGSLKTGVKMYVENFDIDASSDYLSSWAVNRVVVSDLRRGVHYSYIAKGTVLAAPVIRGVAYVHVQTDEGVVIYQFNPVTGGVTAVSSTKDVFVSFVSDGYTKIISYGKYSAVFTPVYGLIYLPYTGAAAVATLDTDQALPSHIKGVAIAAFQDAFGLGVYTVSDQPTLLAVSQAGNKLLLTRRYIAEVYYDGASPARYILASDLAGVPRLLLLTGIAPIYVACGEEVIAYSDGTVTYVIPFPRAIGKYSVTIQTYDAETGAPVDAEVRIHRDIVVYTVNGAYTFYLTKPGLVEFSASAPHYEPAFHRVAVNETITHVVVSIPMTPRKYTLRVRAVDPNGREVREADVSLYRDGVLVERAKAFTPLSLRAGNYTVVASSPVHSAAETQVELTSDLDIVLVINQTHSRIRFYLVDDSGRPASNGQVFIALPDGSRQLMANASGYTDYVALPIGAEISYTASAPGLRTQVGSLTVSPGHDGETIQVILNRPLGTISVSVVDERGAQTRATVRVVDVSGNVVAAAIVDGVFNFDVPLGTYSLEASTDDGRTGSTVVSLTEDSPNQAATIVLPKPPGIEVIEYLPYAVAGGIVATILLFLYRTKRKSAVKVKRVSVPTGPSE